MIRSKGFARKTRRPTKGGSLSENVRQTDPAGSRSSNGSDEPGHNGTNGNHSGNGSSSSNGHTGAFTPISRFLQEALVSLRSSERYSNQNVNGKDNLTVSRGINGGPVLETLLARASDAILLDGRARSRPMPRWKRILDLTCIFLTLPVWLPLLLLVMLWIKAVSPGPIFYRQERVGYRRTRFMIYKFRTMHANAETRTHEEYFAQLMQLDCPMTKLDAVDDSRLVRCGRLLRASGLDELPQIFNVIRGEMSLVGPRPCLPNEFERYQERHRRRVNAPPGLTGYWQVNGKNKTTFSQMIAMDILYTRKMSLWLDMVIIAKTIPALISQTIETRTPRNPFPITQQLAVNGRNGSGSKL